MKNKRIGLDLDGVLYPFPIVCYDILNKKHNFGFDEIEFWSRTKRSNRFYGKHRVEVDKIVADPNTYFAAHLSDDTKKVLNKLADKNELFYITARPPHLKPVTELWFNYNDIPCKKNLYIGYHSKREIVQELKLDILVDDRDYIIEEVKDITNAFRFWSSYLTEDDVLDSHSKYISDLSELLTINIW